MKAVTHFDVVDEPKMQHVRMSKNQSNIDCLKVKSGYLLHNSSNFDVLECYKAVGIMKKPDVPVAVFLILALHASNAFQERIFSA